MVHGTPALVRIARRQVGRHRRRSALIVALIALPVAVVAAGLAVTATTAVTPEEVRPQELGRADLVVGASGGLAPDESGLDRRSAAIEQALRSGLPAGSTLAAAGESWHFVSGGDRARGANVVVADGAHPAHDGRFRLDEGAWPDAAGDVALSPRLAQHLRVAVGDDVTMYLPAGETSLEVVGLASKTRALREDAAIVPPGTVPTTGWVVDLPAGADPDAVAASLVGAAGLEGVPVRSADQALGDSGALQGLGLASVWYVVGALALAWTGVVAGATFAIGARSRLREVGLVAAAGGTQRQVRRLLLADGLVLGLLGSTLGLAAGIAVAPAVVDVLDPWADRDVGSFEVPILSELGALALGTGAALLAAWWPARRAARMPTKAALDARITRPPRRARSTVGGTVALGVGAVLLTSGAGAQAELPVVAGTMLVVAGVAMLHRLLIDAVARVARGAPLAVRLAARDASRQASRTGPAVVASMLALAAAVAAVTMIATFSAWERADATGPGAGDGEGWLQVTWDAVAPGISGKPGIGDGTELVPERDGPRLADAVTTAVGARRLGASWWAEPAGGATAFGPERPFGSSVATAGTLAALGVDDEALGAFRRGAALHLEGPGPSSVRLAEGEGGAGEVPAVDAGLAPNSRAAWLVGPLVVSPETAERLGLTRVTAVSALLDLGRPVDDDTADRALAGALRVTGGGNVWVASPGEWFEGYRTAIFIAAGLGLAVALPVLGLVAGLTRSEARSELAVLDAVGIGPRRRRRFAAAGTGLLAAFASMLALPAGLIPAVLFLRAVGEGPDTSDLALPWDAMALVLVGAPLALAVLGWLTAGRPRPLAALRP